LSRKSGAASIAAPPSVQQTLRRYGPPQKPARAAN